MPWTILIYGLALAVGALALEWLHEALWAGGWTGEATIGLIAAAFLGLGVWLGVRLFRRPSPGGGFEPNLRALASLGITEREYEVLRLIASGQSNKQIAGRLNVSPNTVKTHVSRVFEKLRAARRTEAVLRARELGLLP
jgi:DNA-binding CsgD family transcriptional regulator